MDHFDHDLNHFTYVLGGSADTRLTFPVLAAAYRFGEWQWRADS